MSKLKLLYLFTFFIIFACGCASMFMERDWEQTKNINSVAGYSSFLSKYPHSPYRNEARKNIDELEFAAAERENTIEAYSAFIQSHSASDKSTSAKQRIEAIRQAEADGPYSSACQINTVAAYEDFIKKYPSSPQVTEARNRIHDIRYPPDPSVYAEKNFSILAALWTDEEQFQFAGLSLIGMSFQTVYKKISPPKGCVFLVVEFGIAHCDIAPGFFTVPWKEIMVIEPDGTESSGLIFMFGAYQDKSIITWLDPEKRNFDIACKDGFCATLFTVKKSSLKSLKMKFLGKSYPVGNVEKAQRGELSSGMTFLPALGRVSKLRFNAK